MTPDDESPAGADGPSESAPLRTELVVVYHGRNATDAYLAANFLQAAGIAARVDGEYLQTAIGDIPAGIASAARVLVRADQAVAAQTLLETVHSIDDDPLPDGWEDLAETFPVSE